MESEFTWRKPLRVGAKTFSLNDSSASDNEYDMSISLIKE